MQRYFVLSLILLASVLALGAQTAQITSSVPPVQAQVLAPGDLIAVQVYEAPELTTVGRLDAEGVFHMPQAGAVPLAGKTAAGAAATLAARLQQNYLLHPRVQVVVRSFAPEPVTVSGAVGAPGVYSARTYPDLPAMLAAAGGIHPSAGADVEIDPPNGAAVRIPVKLLRRGTAPRVPLHAGDMIRVEPGATVYVGGNVARPGAYPLPPTGLSMLEAITLAGGTERNSRLKRTRIVHRTAKGKLETEWIDAQRVMQGEGTDPQLQPYDLVYVPWSPGKSVLAAGAQLAATTAAQIIFGIIVFHWSPPVPVALPQGGKLIGQ